MSRSNSCPLPDKPFQVPNTKSPLSENPETSWSADDKVYATSAPGGWNQQPETQPISQPYIIQPDDPAYGRPLVLNRMDSPLQDPEDSVSSVIRGFHEDEMRELVAVVKELREQAARDAELIAELRGQAEDNARAIGGLRIESERLMKELFAAASEARAAATAATAVTAVTPAVTPAAHSPPAPPKADEEKKASKQVPPVSNSSVPETNPIPPSIPKITSTNPPSSPAVPQATPSSPNQAMFETYDHMVNLLKTKPCQNIQLGDYPWPMFPESADSFPRRINLRVDVKKEKVCAFVQAYTSAYGSGKRKERGEAMVKAWKSIMDRSEDTILNGTAARAFTYMDMAARSL